MSFKLTNGLFIYDSNILSGGTTTFGSPFFEFTKPLNLKNQVSASYELHLNITEQTTSLSGIGVRYKYYFHGTGSYKTNRSKNLVIQSRTKWSSFLGTGITKYNYYLGSNSLQETRFEQTGSFYNLNFLAGTEYDIKHSYKVFVDLSYSILSFYSSDDRVKLRGILISTGLSKEF